MRILHLSAHMGAGAGKAISGITISDMTNSHEIILLARPEKLNHIQRCRQIGITVEICPNKERLREMAKEVDVLVINWWHHPLIYKALIDISDIPSRMVIWSHVNGINYPRLNPDFLRLFEGCMFTSEISFQNPDWSDRDREAITEKSALVYGMGDFRPKECPKKSGYTTDRSIRVGYAGSLDYAKLHPDFIKWLEYAVDLNDNLYFELAGDPSENIRNDAKRSTISDHIIFLGFRADIKELLPSWDIFIYLLNPFNFATTENALLEAMAAGLPIVSSGGDVERTIITNKENGLLAMNEKVFANELNVLSKDEALRKELGERAREDVIKKYDVEHNRLKFESVMDMVIKLPKTTHDFQAAIGKEAFDWFLSGCKKSDEEELRILSESERNNKDRDRILIRADKLKGIYKGTSKGSVKQYAVCYPKDKRLSNLSEIIKESQEIFT